MPATSRPEPCDLAGLSVLVTRPRKQAGGLSTAIQEARGRPVGFPTLEILGPADKTSARAALAAIATADLAIFISRNAVQYAFPLMPDKIPLDLQIAAVGSATAHALHEAGLDPTLVPERMDSEGLLALPALHAVQGKNILIVRGNGGRGLLREELRKRGAQVDYAEVYRRVRPERNTDNLVHGWDRMVDVVTVTSAEILDNLFTLLGAPGVGLLRDTPLVVVSRRLAEHAAGRGCRKVYLAESATDSDIVATLCEVNEDVG